MIPIANTLMRYKDKLFIACILIVAAVLRFYQLDFQSLWLDELYTMKEADPSISWKETMKLVLEYEQNPPLYFLLQKVMMSIFGHTAFAARSLSVVAGLAGVYCIFLLGRTLFNAKAGYIAALLTAVNYFHITYSQEARGYAFLFLFSVLAVLGVVNLLRQPGWKTAFLAGLFSVLLIHFHPYGVFVLMALGIIAIIHFLSENEKLRFLKYSSLGLIVFIGGSLPLVGEFTEAAKVTSSWIKMPGADYFIEYFKEYFGSPAFLVPLFCAIMIYYVVKVFSEEGESLNWIESPLKFSFVLFSLWLTCVYFIPYLRSATVVPMLVPRYTIVGLPAFILILAGGISLINGVWLRTVIVFLTAIILLVNFIYIGNYYHQPAKAQFREVAELVKKSGKAYTVYMSSRTWWQHSYYMQRLKIDDIKVYSDKEAQVDEILKAAVKGDAQGFWMLGAHNEVPLSDAKRMALDSLFMVTQTDFLNAWALCCIPDKESGNVVKKLSCRDFNPNNVAKIEGDSVVTLWEGEFRESRPFSLSAGDYKLRIVSKGTPMKDVFPHLQLFAGSTQLGEMTNTYNYELSQEFKLYVKKDTTLTLKLRMDNDQNDSKTGEDRNAFLKSVLIFQ